MEGSAPVCTGRRPVDVCISAQMTVLQMVLKMLKE